MACKQSVKLESTAESETQGYPDQKLETETANFELTKIKGFLPEIEGCNCSYAETLEDLENEQYIYFNDYEDLEIISVNDQLVRLDLSKPDLNHYKIIIQIATEEQTGYEVRRQTGTIAVTSADGQVVKRNFVGDCGC